ncbi:hypothetical protein ACSOOQ_001477 [Escherichia coli]|nr:hypothetical protein [Escherichia coli]
MLSVFPAPAGINRQKATRYSGWMSVPRASGDKPQAAQKSSVLQSCSPRQRG